MAANASELLNQLDGQVEARHLLRHPFYQAWQSGRLDRNVLQLYAAQYYQHVKAFPENLRRLAARSEGELRALVLENLAEELDPQRTHPQLWRDFASAVGANESALDQAAPLPGTQALVETYQRICGERSLPEAVAALYAYEAQVPEIATQKIAGLQHFYGVTEEKGLAYFTVHEEADQRHRAAWRQWLERYGQQAAEGVLETAEEALSALWGALDSIYSAWPLARGAGIAG
jgi:pyrroloquinoline-quinone synthase